MDLASQKTAAPASLKFAWSSIAQGARNYGNLLIEHCLRQALGLPEPTIVFNSFQPLRPEIAERINRECTFVLSPGCTALQPGQNAAYANFDRIRVPKPCFGGSM